MQARAQRAAAEGGEQADAKAPAPTHAEWRWAALVFTKRQACAFVLNELVYRLPLFEPFFSTGARSVAFVTTVTSAATPTPSVQQVE